MGDGSGSHPKNRQSFAMKRNKGYTLIEVIIAFALLALALVILLGALSQAVGQVRQSEYFTRATLYAQSLMVLQETQSTLQPKNRSGDFENGQYHWTLHIHPYRDPSVTFPPASDPPPSTELLELVLDVRWGSKSNQHITWRTLRYVRTVVSKGNVLNSDEENTDEP